MTDEEWLAQVPDSLKEDPSHRQTALRQETQMAPPPNPSNL